MGDRGRHPLGDSPALHLHGRVDPGSAPDARALHVGFVSPRDANDAAALSGMPYRMRLALEQRVERISIFPPTPDEPAQPRVWTGLVQSMVRPLPAGVKHALRSPGAWAPVVRWRLMPARASRLAEARARDGARRLDEWIERTRPDAVFACFVSGFINGLRSEVPLVYFTDTTARVLTRTYPRSTRCGPLFSATYDGQERGALRRATVVAFASEAGHRSALRDYGRDPARTHVVPMGAHVTPSPERAALLDPRPPSRDHLEICIVGADPRRKRLDFAVDACERLRRDGYHAVLHVVGPSTRRARRSPAVRLSGRLSLASPVDRRRHEEILERSHLMILPSIGEAFGIAPCEAAHFGRPSVVSDAGGLPTVVLDGVTGVVLPVSAGPDAYARAIARIVDEPEQYQAMSRAALERARRLLNWDAWGDSIARLLVAAHESATSG